MNESTSWRSGSESWRGNEIPLPPQQDRHSIPSLMDPPEVNEKRKKIDELRQKITDSEQNLRAHRNGLDDMLVVHLKTAIRSAENTKIDNLLTQQNLNIEELAGLLDAMSHSKCSKDLIQQAKKWIFEYCTTDQLREIILTYLLNKVKDELSPEYLRLHILYLINDWAFHCQRKKEDNQMKMLARYVSKMYAYCIELSSSPEISEKLEGKLLGEWEGRGYFTDAVFKQLRNTVQIVSQDREFEKSSYGALRESIRSTLVSTFDGYEQQHVVYSQHIQSQIDEMEREIQELRHGPPAHQLPPSNLRRSRFDQAPSSRPIIATEQQTWRSIEPVAEDIDGTPFDEEVVKPQKSYLALPAGIMVPLVPIGSFKYEPLNPDNLEMPVMMPPSQRLQSARIAFLKGVEMDMMAAEGATDDFVNFPADFLDKKAKAKKEFMEKQRVSLEDLITNRPSTAEKQQFEREKKRKEEEQITQIRNTIDAYYGPSEPPPPSEEPRKQQSPSRSPTRERDRRSRSFSRSPRGGRRARSSSSSSGSSSSSSRSSSNSSSRSRKSPERGRFGSRGNGGGGSLYSDSFRPSFGGSSSSKSSFEPLSSDNKGAQLMAKMGWTSGRGLGSNETGIVDPVSGGEVRDRNEQFIGFGRTLDPYEQFRKQRSGTYHERGTFHRK